MQTRFNYRGLVCYVVGVWSGVSIDPGDGRERGAAFPRNAALPIRTYLLTSYTVI